MDGDFFLCPFPSPPPSSTNSDESFGEKDLCLSDQKTQPEQKTSPEKMSFHVYARSYRDELHSFSSLPTARELLSRLGTADPVKYYMCVPSQRPLQTTQLQPIIHHPCTPCQPIVVSHSPQPSAFRRPEYVEPVKKPKSTAKKRKLPSVAMNTADEASNDLVSPPAAKQQREQSMQLPFQRQSFGANLQPPHYVVPKQEHNRGCSPFPSTPGSSLSLSPHSGLYSPQGNYQRRTPSPMVAREERASTHSKSRSMHEWSASYEQMVAEQEARERRREGLQTQMVSKSSPPLQPKLATTPVLLTPSPADRRAAFDRMRLQPKMRMIQHAQQRPQLNSPLSWHQPSSGHLSTSPGPFASPPVGVHPNDPRGQMIVQGYF